MDTAVLQTYLHVVKEGSFSAAARRMGISKSMSSKYISDLEDSLGVRLLTRTTRSVSPTVAGQEYYDRLSGIMAELDRTHECLRGLSERPSGPLRIGSPVSYMLRVLNPLMMRFMEAYPEVQLDLVLDDRTNDLVQSGLDAVIRIGELSDSSLIARRLHQVEVMVVAAPAYLEAHGMPERPSDLSAHRLLHYSHMQGAGTWRFANNGEILHQRIQPVFSANNGDMLRAAALEGKGLAPLLGFFVEEDLAAGRLVRVLPDYALSDLPVSLIYPAGENMRAALRVFIDFLNHKDQRAFLTA